jgi:RNA polymerase sigma-70 factor, ECF subfamily
VKGLKRTPRSTDRTDDVLLASIVEGDLGALGELYDRYARDVWRATYQMHGNAADAEDIVHTVFMKLPEIAKSYDGRSNARPWLVGIAIRIASRHHRGISRFLRTLRLFATTAPHSRELNPEREASARQELSAVDSAIAALAPHKRIVFTLIELEGLTSEEVGRALSIPAATVRTRLHHARRDLYAAMKASKGES